MDNASDISAIHPSRLAQLNELANSVCCACGGNGHLSQDCPQQSGLTSNRPTSRGKGANAEPLGKRRKPGDVGALSPKRQRVHEASQDILAGFPFDLDNWQAPPRQDSPQQSWQPPEPVRVKHEERRRRSRTPPSPELLALAPRPSGKYSRYTSFQKLAPANDPSLLHYLSTRRISKYFLSEIDQLLSSHPELLHEAREFVAEFNRSSPLAAYKFFIKGYTKPARYVPFALPDIDDLKRVLPYAPISAVAKTFDEELTAFFEGYVYRVDILRHIDTEVECLRRDILDGYYVSPSQRRLVIYALYGNPVDAYKYYEYNFQQEWLPHRYLPEHVVLAEVSKPRDYDLPVARLMSHPDDLTPEHLRLWKSTRLHMARAADAGVDVIDVLLDDFVHALVVKGLKRAEIDEMRHLATEAIDHRRAIRSREDIVDVVMGMTEKPEKYLRGGSERHEDEGSNQRRRRSRSRRDSRPRKASMQIPEHHLQRLRNLKRTHDTLTLQEISATGSAQQSYRERVTAMRQRIEQQYANELAAARVRS